MKKILLLGLTIITLTSCVNLSYFTEDLRQQNGWGPDEIKGIQFYLSEDVVLRAVQKENQTKIEDGEIQVRSGSKQDNIEFPKRSKGVLLEMVSNDQFHVAFEDCDCYLVFKPDSRQANKYVIQAYDWNNREGKVKYNGQQYTITANDGLAALMVNIKKVNRTYKSKRRVKGRKI